MIELLHFLNQDLGPHLTVAGYGLWAGLVGMGFCIGILTGLFGVGGGFLVVPLLYAIFGIPYDIAVGSSLCFIIGTSSAGLPKYVKIGWVEPKTIFVLAIGSMTGAVLGDLLQNVLIEQVAGGDAILFNKIMSGLFIALLMVTALLVYREPKPHATGQTPMQRFPIGPHINLANAGLENVSLTGMVLVGLGVGIMTGVFGVGGGVLIMPILLIVVGLQPHPAVGTSLGVVLLASIAGTIKKGMAGKVNLSVALLLLVGSAIGVQVGIFLCNKLHAQGLRRSFAIVVLFAAVILAVKLISSL